MFTEVCYKRMMASGTKVGFKVWAGDNQVHGPMELPQLVQWVQDNRVKASTWIFSQNEDSWRKASDVSELRLFFQRRAAPAAASASEAAVPPEALRRVKILSDLSDEDLARFLTYMEVQTARAWMPIVRQGEHGDSMFIVLDGEVRVRLLIDNKEATLVTLGAGDFFGEISLFDHGPRSADVVANSDAVLLKMSHKAFTTLIHEAPELAAPVLIGIGKTLTSRIRADNKRYRDTIVLARAVK
jgi:hypothetical protein